MTETEARQFIKRFESLCSEFERDCNCRIEFNIKETRKGVRNLKWITIESISLKIDR